MKDEMNAADILIQRMHKIIKNNSQRIIFPKINIQFSALFTLVLCTSPIFTSLKRAVPLIIQKPIKATSHMHMMHNSTNVRNGKGHFVSPTFFSCVRLISLH